MKKGPLGEALWVRYLQANGYPSAERRVQGGEHDRGDIGGIPGLVTEVKNASTVKLAEWIDETERERKEAQAEAGVLVHKRRGKAWPGDWYVTMTGKVFVAEFLPAWTEEMTR